MPDEEKAEPQPKAQKPTGPTPVFLDDLPVVRERLEAGELITKAFLRSIGITAGMLRTADDGRKYILKYV